jgi:uncharacterized membrane protein YhaH (DUF805 family)
MPTSRFVITLLLQIAFLPALAMRLKDINITPAISLLYVIPPLALLLSHLTKETFFGALDSIGYGTSMVMGLAVIVLIFVPGTKGPNPYGPDPLQPTV